MIEERASHAANMYPGTGGRYKRIYFIKNRRRLLFRAKNTSITMHAVATGTNHIKKKTRNERRNGLE